MGNYRQSGLSLIEALIALLVLSIGLVGLGALMMTSLKSVHSSAHYSVASAIALDVEELLWSEMAEAVTGTDPNNNTDLNDNGCLPDADVTTLLADIETRWNTTSSGDGGWADGERFKLPNLAMTLESVSDTAASSKPTELFWKDVTIEITWDEGRFANEADGESYTASMTVPCRPTQYLDQV